MTMDRRGSCQWDQETRRLIAFRTLAMTTAQRLFYLDGYRDGLRRAKLLMEGTDGTGTEEPVSVGTGWADGDGGEAA